MHTHRQRVEARVAEFLDDKSREADRLAPEAAELAGAIRDLTLRGGKRLRPILAAASARAIEPGLDLERTVDVGAALELLQTYLLTHDDWMDNDEERRGGPSVLKMLRDRHPEDAHLSACLTVLAGDLACAYAAELMTAAPFPRERAREGLTAFWEIHRDVFFGQHLDLVGSTRIDAKYDLKTGSYTVRGPVRLGAIVANATPIQMEALARFAAPLGVAFQLADDLLGTFGAREVTGKPLGGDLRTGKRTSLVAALEAAPETADRTCVLQVLGRADASDDALAEATCSLERSGARAAVEARRDALFEEARRALDGAPVESAELVALARALVVRDH